MTDSPRLDPAALTRLDKLGGPGFARRIIGIFLTEGPRRIADAREALGRRDGPALAHAVHALISSSGNVGAMDLADLVRQLEQEAEQRRWDVLPTGLARLDREFDAVRGELERVMEAASGS
jgi:two-component system sensor histidine kinase/response regulator